MDWSKVKNILIFVFIGLNIFLFTFILQAKGSREVSASVIKDTEKVLSVNGVKLECKIPSYNKQTGSAVTGKYYIDKSKVIKELAGNNAETNIDFEYDKEYKFGQKVITFLDNSTFKYSNSSIDSSDIDISTINQAEKYIRKLFKAMGISTSGFVVDQSSTNEDGSMTLRFLEQYNDNIDVFDSKIVATVTQNGVKDIQCSIHKVSETKEPMKIVAAYQVILRSCNVRGTTIKAIDFGFKAGSENSDSGTMQHLPVWRITLGDGKVKFFDAYSGEEYTE